MTIIYQFLCMSLVWIVEKIVTSLILRCFISKSWRRLRILITKSIRSSRRKYSEPSSSTNIKSETSRAWHQTTAFQSTLTISETDIIKTLTLFFRLLAGLLALPAFYNKKLNYKIKSKFN